MPRNSIKRTQVVESGISPWWVEDDYCCHTQLRALVDYCETHYEAQRRTENLLYLAMYGDRWAFRNMAGDWSGQRLKFNLTKSVIDTVAAEVSGMRPTTSILTQQGDWGLQQSARNLELAVRGEFDANRVWAKGQSAFLDAGKTGLSGFHVYNSGWRPKIEVLPIGSILVDPVEARYGAPKTVYRLGLIPRYEVLGRWGSTPELRQAIEREGTADHRHWFPWLPDDTQVDHLLVIEAHREPDPDDWRNPDKGRHVIALSNATLLDEEWDRRLPYSFYRYDQESGDFFGRGIASNLLGLQRELNMVLGKIQECIELAAGPIRWVPDGAVDIEQFDDIPGAIIRYTGAQAPTLEVASTVPQQLLDHAETIIRRGYEQEGVSMMAAMARKPAGLNSGAALREHNDIESKRFRIHSQAYERWLAVDTAELVIDEKRWIAQQPGAKPPELLAQVSRGRRKSLRSIPWTRCQLDPDSYRVQVQPTSSLPSQPSGRTAMVEQWLGAGLITSDEAKQLLDFPDTDAFTRRAMASHDFVLWHVETMLEDGEYIPPDPAQNVDQSIALANQSYLLAQMDGAPEDRTELVLRYMDDLRAYQERAMEAAMQQQQAAAPAGPVDPAAAAQMSLGQAAA